MFENLKSLVVTPSAKVSTRKVAELPRTSAFVQQLREADLRLTYAALASAAVGLGEHEVSGMSAGQRGASLVSGLPEDLQPFVCRANGRYKKGAPVAAIAEEAGLLSKGFVRPEEIDDFVNAFITATSAQESEQIDIGQDDNDEEGDEDLDD